MAPHYKFLAFRVIYLLVLAEQFARYRNGPNADANIFQHGKTNFPEIGKMAATKRKR